MNRSAGGFRALYELIYSTRISSPNELTTPSAAHRKSPTVRPGACSSGVPVVSAPSNGAAHPGTKKIGNARAIPPASRNGRRKRRGQRRLDCWSRSRRKSDRNRDGRPKLRRKRPSGHNALFAYSRTDPGLRIRPVAHTVTRSLVRPSRPGVPVQPEGHHTLGGRRASP